MKRFICYWLLSFGVLAAPALAAPQTSRVIEVSLQSRSLESNRIGIDPRRNLRVYLPAGYDSSRKPYPVIYYFHSIFWSNRQMFEDGAAQRVLDGAIARRTIGEFILVAGDFTTPNVGTFFGNTDVTGRWQDHILDELVPFVDANFRTMPQAASRGLAGDFLGGYIALRLAMMHPDRFSTVYALHPVGTGSGLIPMSSRPDWRKMNLARSWADLDDGFSQVFMAMAQTYLPNPDRPPFYCDLAVELKDGILVTNLENTRKLHSTFLLDQLVPQYAANLKRLAAIGFDWGRYDPTQDHVYSNQAFTRTLDDYGIVHVAEEYAGNHYDRNWIENGRVSNDMLPFFARALRFD